MGDKQEYFADADARDTFHDELKYLLLHQKASFNSPVYFNVGIEAKPQCSACFILKVEDSMDSILSWYRNEGMIFKRRLRRRRQPVGAAREPRETFGGRDRVGTVVVHEGR